MSSFSPTIQIPRVFPKFAIALMAMASFAVFRPEVPAADEPAAAPSLAVITPAPDGGTGAAAGELSPGQAFKAANQQYAAGQYAAALQSYEGLMARGWASSALYFNAGNAAAQLNRKALAVLYFERALTLAPRDPDIQYNLRLVAPPDNFQTVFILFRPFWFVRHQMRPGELLFCAAGLYVLGAAFLALTFIARRPGLRRAGRWSGAIALMLALYFGYNFYAQHHARQVNPLSIVMQPATARSGPGENFKTVLELPEGLKVHDNGPAGPGWREIQLLTGQTGYLPSAALTPIALDN